MYLVFFFLVLVLVISTVYLRIVICLSKRAKDHRVQNAATKSKLKAVRMLVLMVLGFVLCWGPTNVLSTLRSYHLLDQESFNVIAVVTMVAEILMYCSSVINPLLYGYYNGDFRRQVFRSCGNSSCSCIAINAVRKDILTGAVQRARTFGGDSSGSVSLSAVRPVGCN